MFCRRFSYNAPGSGHWRQEKQSAIDRNLETVESYAPTIRASTAGHSAPHPLDPGEKPGLIGGNIFSTARQDSIDSGQRARC
jgi:hypothetical protein